jgi:hypothetical protein
MRDTSATLCRASRTAPRAAIAALLLAVACGLGGCAGGGAVGGSFAMAGGGSTVAFESIDGPPPHVFDRMVDVLDSESKLRNLSIVSRDGSAAYRVRSYLAAQVSRGRTVIAWVWDVYDRDQQRALRLSGRNQPARPDATPGPPPTIWLRKIAQAGLSGLSALINGTAPDSSPAPGLRGPAVAGSERPSAVAGEFSVTALGYGSH